MLQQIAHGCRVHPVVGRAGVFLLGGTDKGAIFDPRHITWVGTCEKGVWTLDRVELAKRARIDQLLAQALVFRVRPVAPHHAGGLCQPSHLCHPGKQGLVPDRRRGIQMDARFGNCVHEKLPRLKINFSKEVRPGACPSLTETPTLKKDLNLQMHGGCSTAVLVSHPLR